jgi:NAD(P)-dependent dehydrogenase (short-subunit alcohol dehydrogenase family)
MNSILITGGSRGIGRATVLLAAERGWNVALSYVGNREAAERTAEEARKKGVIALCIQGDVGSEADVGRIFHTALDAFGSLEGVVINAGIVAPAMPLRDMTSERLQMMFQTNILGAYLCAREAVRCMRRGSIVNVSSLAAKTGSPGEYVDYAGSKAAMDALTIGLAKEAGR